MPTLAKDAKRGKMYKLTRKATLDLGSNTWYEVAPTTAAKYIDRLRVRQNSCTGRQMFQIGQFRDDPTMILFVRIMRGSDTFSGKYEIKQKMLIPADQPLREIKHRPGYTRAKSDVEPSTTYFTPTVTDSVPSIATGTRSVEEVDHATSMTNDSPSAFDALKATPLAVEDVMQDTIDRAITDKNNQT